MVSVHVCVCNAAQVMVDAVRHLQRGVVESSGSGSSAVRIVVGNGVQLTAASSINITLLDGAAWSTAFYAANIIESKAA